MIRGLLGAGYFLGGAAILLSFAALIFTVVTRYIGEPADPPPSDPPEGRRTPPAVPVPVFDPGSPPPNYTRGDELHQWPVEAELDLAEALTAKLEKFVGEEKEPDDTVELPAVDPLAQTTELEAIDPLAPLFYSVRRPAPGPDIEGPTRAWELAGLRARIREATDAEHR